MMHRIPAVLAVLVLGPALVGGALAQTNTDQAQSSTTISGRVFGDFSYKDSEVGGVKTNDTGTGIDIKRFYLGVGHIFDPNWSASVVLDIGDKGNVTGCTPTTITAAVVDADGTIRNHEILVPCSVSGGDNKRYDVFAKNAYIQYKYSDAAMIRLGAAANPWISFAEEMYGQRYIENTLIDRDVVKYGESADGGLHFLGKAAGGVLNYALSAVNGLGYSDPKRTKTMDLEGRIGVQPIKGLNFAAGFYTGKRGKDLETAPAANTASRLDALAAYIANSFRVGVEWFSARNWNSVNRVVTPEEKAEGFSAYGRVHVAPKMELFARYDSTKPDTEGQPDVKRNYYNGGLQFDVNKSVTASLVWKNDKLDTPLASTRVSVNEVGLFAQYTF